ncbi:MAG: ATP-binding protein [Pseudomonadota bacterium]
MSDSAEWIENNEKHLTTTVAWVRRRLEQLVPPADDVIEKADTGGWFRRTGKPKEIARPATPAREVKALEHAPQEITALEQTDPPPAFSLLAKHLGLSDFDRHVLALCVAMEFDARVPALCARAQGDPNRPYPTFTLAFAAFDEPDWEALSPNAPLRYWRLLEINQRGTQPLTAAALGADERIVNYLKGLNYLDDRLAPLLALVPAPSEDDTLPASQQQTVDDVVERLRQSDGTNGLPVVELLGHDPLSKRLIAAHVAVALGVNLYAIDSKALPGETGDLETFIRLWQRESRLMPLALYLDCRGAGSDEKQRLKRFIERCHGVVFADNADTKTDTIRARLTAEVNRPTPMEQQRLWSRALQRRADDVARNLSVQYSFAQRDIRRLGESALESGPESELGQRLWQSCRAAARAGMEQLAQRIDAKATWDQIVLSPDRRALLQQITDQVGQRNRVYDDWGFRETMNRGLGINALFAGESGTGKTMAAEVIANALSLDLFRIDLSAVVSKYIGETEKNLRKLFDAAEDSGAILFFDEADALFGKRSEVKDSHDRYANIEINYLLQRMEAYRGLAVLATNMKGALDTAFVRRLRFIVDFPFPGIDERVEIWRKVFPAGAPVDESLDYRRLARLSLTGGNIHNVALNAAFLAAREGSSITMPLVLNAARTEFRKLDRPAKESDFRWQGPERAVL